MEGGGLEMHGSCQTELAGYIKKKPKSKLLIWADFSGAIFEEKEDRAAEEKMEVLSFAAESLSSPLFISIPY